MGINPWPVFSGRKAFPITAPKVRCLRSFHGRAGVDDVVRSRNFIGPNWHLPYRTPSNQRDRLPVPGVRLYPGDRRFVVSLAGDNTCDALIIGVLLQAEHLLPKTMTVPGFHLTAPDTSNSSAQSALDSISRPSPLHFFKDPAIFPCAIDAIRTYSYLGRRFRRLQFWPQTPLPLY